MRFELLVEQWRAARAAMIVMPFGAPEGRSRLNALSEAEYALFTAAGGMDGPPFAPGIDSAAPCYCPLCTRSFVEVGSLIQHLRDSHQ